MERLRDDRTAFVAGRIAIVVAGLPFKCPAAPNEAAFLLGQRGYLSANGGNADRFDHRETRILIYDDDPDQLAVAEEIRAALGVPLSDFTNGYRLYSPRAVEYLATAPLRETGYISLSEWAYALHRAGMSVAEVPTVFINRRLGTSNMSAGEALNALRGLIRMKRRTPAIRE
mgnify:CR=1 FL=1